MLLRCFPMLLVGCAPATGTPDRSTSPYAPPPSTPAEPSIAPERVAAAIPELVSLVTAADPDGIVAAYEAIMIHGDADCPGEIVTGDVRSWFLEEPCTSSDGTHFAGEGYLQRYPDEGAYEIGVELLDIAAPDGAFMRGSFSIYAGTFPEDGETYHYFEVQADVQADPASAAGNPWLSGTRGSVSVEGADASGTRSLAIHGNLRAAQTGDVVAVSFTDLAIGDEDCTLAVTGAAALRDAAGAWHDVGYDAATCDACGELRFGSTTLGGFCHDDSLAQLLAWGDEPW